MDRQLPLQNVLGNLIGYPTTPGTGGYPSYPGYTGGSTYPGYPGGSTYPGYPTGGTYPSYPGAGTYPGYPGGGTAPGYPGGGYPGYPAQPGLPGTPGAGFPRPPVPGPGPGPGPGQQGQGHTGAPTSAPPSFTPQKPATTGFGVKAVNPGAIAGCLYRNVYIWQSNGQSYWAYLTFVGRNSIAGYRWIGFTWIYFGLDLRFVDQFLCF